MGSAAVAALFFFPTHTKPTCLKKLKISSYPSSISQARAKKHRFVPVLYYHLLLLDEKKHPGNLPRTYTLTHSDITSKITLAVSQTINRAQGWYNRLQRDEVVAEWKKVQEKMSLHVHCHISGGHFLLDFIAKLRHYIFCKELPVVLKAFVHGDGNLFNNYPELEEALVWVYFHSNLPEFNRVECWGPLKEAMEGRDLVEPQFSSSIDDEKPESNWVGPPRPCNQQCSCCFPPSSLIPWPQDFQAENSQLSLHQQQ
ncbi:stay-green [Asimina triloba]